MPIQFFLDIRITHVAGLLFLELLLDAVQLLLIVSYQFGLVWIHVVG